MRQNKNGKKEKRPLVLISDSTGDLGERLLRALTSQFPKNSFSLNIFRFVETDVDLRKVLEQIQTVSPLLFHTMISETMKKEIAVFAAQNKIPAFDLTGEAMNFLRRQSGLKTIPNYRSLHELNQEYENRIAALSFTVEHDDGVGASSWGLADILLVGVSRTSKTPTSIYLANKGFKVANVPVIKNYPLPNDLPKGSGVSIVGLTIDPERLQEIRIKRAQADKIPGQTYTDLDQIKDEIAEANQLFSVLHCPVIDVTHHAVEEVAALIQNSIQAIPA